MEILIWLQLSLLVGLGHGLVLPETATIVLPPNTAGVTNTPMNMVLICGVTEQGVSDMNSTWYTPIGDIINVVGNIQSSQGRFTLLNFPGPVGSLYSITSLRVDQLSYQDEGKYICTARYTLRGSNNILQGNSTINVQLTVEVNPIISRYNGIVGRSVMLSCQMSRYLRPDSLFLWRRGGKMITNEGRFSVAYNDLMEDAGQLHNRSASRESTLSISDVEVSDAGNYTCFVNGTDSSGAVFLEVINTPATTSAIDSENPTLQHFTTSHAISTNMADQVTNLVLVHTMELTEKQTSGSHGTRTTNLSWLAGLLTAFCYRSSGFSNY